MKRTVYEIETEEKCSYGCGRLGKYKNGRGNIMCENTSNKCPTVKKKNSEKLKKAHADGRCFGWNKLDEIGKGKRDWNLGLTKETDDRVKNSSEANIGKKRPNCWHKTDAGRNFFRKITVEFYKNHPEKHPNRLCSGNRNKMSYPEKVAFEWLNKNNIKFEHQKKIKTYYVDFLIGNTIIEIDGVYWHPIGNTKDKQRDEELKNLNYIIYRIRSDTNIENALFKIFKTQTIQV